VRQPRDPARTIIALLAVGLAAGGCGPAGATRGSPGAAGPSTVVIAGPSIVPSALPPATAGTASSSPRAGIAVDAGLLDVLPGQVDGTALEPDPVTAAEIGSDSTLALTVEAIAVALAIAPGSSSGDDLAIATVLRLRPGAFSDPWFRTYRTAYDGAACDVAGGVGGQPSELEIGGRTAFVGTCVDGARTYHVRLADRDVVVSVIATGPRRFGELVIAGLAE
jgi:hypothetical protein